MLNVIVIFCKHAGAALLNTLYHYKEQIQAIIVHAYYRYTYTLDSCSTILSQVLIEHVYLMYLIFK